MIDLSILRTVNTTTTPTNTSAQGASGSGSPYSSSLRSSPSSSSGNLASADVYTYAGATAALSLTDSVLETNSTQLALMGALQNRFTASISKLSSQSMMTQATIGHIVDADTSSEMAKYNKSMILSEASKYLLSGAQ